MRVRHVFVALGVAAGACAGLPALDPPPMRPAPYVPVALRPPAGGGELLARHLAQTEEALDGPLVQGNEGRLLVDGPATHRAMFEAIGRARNHVNLQTYILEPDGPGERLADLLIRKRREGVKVNILYDSVGSMQTPPAYFDRLREAGIAVCEFNPVNPLKSPPKGWQINNRDHRKILVVDGRVAFTGGINISGVYSAGSFGSRRYAPSRDEGWRDTHIATRGPIVAEFQQVFVDAWQRQRCGELPRAAYFPRVAERGEWTMKLVTGDPEAGTSETYVALHAAIAGAERRIWLTYGYFAP